MKHFRALICAACAAAIAVAGPAGAWERHRSGSIATQRGTTAWQGDVTRQRGQMGRQTNWQNGRGDGSRSMNKTWDKSTGTGALDRTTTLANGRTASNDATVTKTGNGYDVSGTYTGYNGKSHDYSGSVNKGE